MEGLHAEGLDVLYVDWIPARGNGPGYEFTMNERHDVLVLGGEGMLGHKVFQILSSCQQDVKCTIFGNKSDDFYARIGLFASANVIDQIDAMDFGALEKLLQKLRPAYVVNCIGIVKQRDEASQSIPSITLNSLLPHRLARALSDWGGRLIHISTDCVFNGIRGSYTEEDLPDAEDLYGRTKALGEVKTANCLTLRTSIIGRELSHFRSLLEWFLAQKNRSIHGYKNAIYTGVTTNFLAETISRLISDQKNLTGLYQVASPPISKYDLLCMLRDAYRLDVEILPNTDVVVDLSLVGEKYLRATGFEQPTWRGLVEQLASDPTPYDDWRDGP